MKNNALSFGDNVENMNKIWKSIVLIISLMGCVSALDGNGVEMRPGEATAEMLFNYGIGQPWVGGNPPSYECYLIRSILNTTRCTQDPSLRSILKLRRSM